MPTSEPPQPTWCRRYLRIGDPQHDNVHPYIDPGFAGVAYSAEANDEARPVRPRALSRFDIDVVVTGYGAADLRGLSHFDRASARVGIAACASTRSPAA